MVCMKSFCVPDEDEKLVYHLLMGEHREGQRGGQGETFNFSLHERFRQSFSFSDVKFLMKSVQVR